MRKLLTLISICTMASLASFCQTEYSFDIEKIDKLVKSNQPDIYKISYHYDSVFMGSWASSKNHTTIALSSSGAYAYHYLIFDEDENFYNIHGFHSNIVDDTATVFCGTFYFDISTGLLYMRWGKCQDSSIISTLPLLYAGISVPNVSKKNSEKVYKPIYLTRGELKEGTLAVYPFGSFYKEALLLVECKKAKWNTPVEKIIKRWNHSKPEEMNVLVFIR